MPVFKIKLMEGEDKIKVVHQNVLLPLFSDPSDHTNVLHMESMVNQTVNAHEVIAVSAVVSHVCNNSAYSISQVASLFQQRLQFVTSLFD